MEQGSLRTRSSRTSPSRCGEVGSLRTRIARFRCSAQTRAKTVLLRRHLRTAPDNVVRLSAYSASYTVIRHIQTRNLLIRGPCQVRDEHNAGSKRTS